MGHLFIADHHLHDARGVAQVQECDPTVIAPAAHPPGEGDCGADVAGTQSAGLVGTKHEVLQEVLLIPRGPRHVLILMVPVPAAPTD